MPTSTILEQKASQMIKKQKQTNCERNGVLRKNNFAKLSPKDVLTALILTVPKAKQINSSKNFLKNRFLSPKL
jgi:hypothetical protein